MADDFTFETKTEQYLHDHEGNLKRYYENVANGANPGAAFAAALCKPDVYRLRKNGSFQSLYAEDDIDGSLILGVIAYLEETAKQYPPDHPLWNLR